MSVITSRVRSVARWLALVVAVIGAVAAATFTTTLSAREAGIDFYHWWAVPTALRAGVGDVYTPAGQEALAQYMAEHRDDFGSFRLVVHQAFWKKPEPTASPLLYAAFAAVTGPRYESDYRRFQAWSSGLAALGLLVLGQLLRVPLAAMLGALAIAWIGFNPMMQEVRVGNVNRVVVLFCAAYVALRFAAARRPERAIFPVLSGLVLGWGILFKPVLVLAPLTLGLNRLFWHQHRELLAEFAGGMLALLAACVAVVLAFDSVALWREWLLNFPATIQGAARLAVQGNVAPRGLFERLAPSLASPLCIVVAVAAVAFQVASLRRPTLPAESPEARARGDFAALGLAVALFLWVSPLVWPHYYVLTLPWLLLAAAEAWRCRNAVPALLAVLTVMPVQSDDIAVARWAIVPFTLLALSLITTSSRAGQAPLAARVPA